MAAGAGARAGARARARAGGRTARGSVGGCRSIQEGVRGGRRVGEMARDRGGGGVDMYKRRMGRGRIW